VKNTEERGRENKKELQLFLHHRGRGGKSLPVIRKVSMKKGEKENSFLNPEGKKESFSLASGDGSFPKGKRMITLSLCGKGRGKEKPVPLVAFARWKGRLEKGGGDNDILLLIRKKEEKGEKKGNLRC